MNRKRYISNDGISLSEYIPELDNMDCYLCWQDEDTQRGYNFRMDISFQEYRKKEIRSRFLATIIRESDDQAIGHISLSPENTLPDLAIMLYRPYRNQGYGTVAFALGIKYCFEVLKLDTIYAGCYEHNTASKKMLAKCGFQPHPQGNVTEKHYLTGEEVVQYDYIVRTEQREKP